MNDLIARLGYVSVNVNNFEECVDDIQGVMGARLVENDGNRALFAVNRRHAEYILTRADKNELRAVGLEAYDKASVDAVAARAERAGMKIVTREPSLKVIDHAVTVRTVEGHVFEVHTPMPLTHYLRHEGAGIHPRCMDHVNLKANDPEAVGTQLQEVFGLRLSERTEGREISWYRAGDGRHHTVGIMKGPSGMHHVSWEFASFIDFQRLGDILGLRDRRISWGPGRHGPGDNLFSYYVDASGLMMECCAEMEHIFDPNFQARVVDPGENLSNYKVLNQWGQLPSLPWLTHHTDFARP